jgi:hypothetical protein
MRGREGRREMGEERIEKPCTKLNSAETKPYLFLPPLDSPFALYPHVYREINTLSEYPWPTGFEFQNEVSTMLSILKNSTIIKRM